MAQEETWNRIEKKINELLSPEALARPDSNNPFAKTLDDFSTQTRELRERALLSQKQDNGEVKPELTHAERRQINLEIKAEKDKYIAQIKANLKRGFDKEEPLKMDSLVSGAAQGGMAGLMGGGFDVIGGAMSGLLASVQQFVMQLPVVGQAITWISSKVNSLINGGESLSWSEAKASNESVQDVNRAVAALQGSGVEQDKLAAILHKAVNEQEQAEPAAVPPAPASPPAPEKGDGKGSDANDAKAKEEASKEKPLSGLPVASIDPAAIVSPGVAGVAAGAAAGVATAVGGAASR